MKILLSCIIAVPLAACAFAGGAVPSCYEGDGPSPSAGSRGESTAATIILGRSSGHGVGDFELRSLTAMESPGTGIDMTYVPGFLLMFR